jgi:hypothetical protein
MRISDGAIDIHYEPSLEDLLKVEVRLVVELAELKASPLEDVDDEDGLRQEGITAREHSIQSIRRLIKKKQGSSRHPLGTQQARPSN